MNRKQTKDKDYKVPALEKGLAILETLSSSREPMSLTDLCRALDRSPSELYRMVGFLEDRGYIVREQHSGNYHLSLKLYELAHMHSPVEQLIKAATIPMRELALAVRESCHLSVLDSSGDLIVLHQQESPEKIRFSVEVGAKFDALGTVSGRLLIAHLPPDERAYFLERHPKYRNMSDGEREQFHRTLEEILEKGYSYAERETHLGIRDTAVLVGNPKVGLAAALCIPSLIVSNKQAFDFSVLEALRECARNITAAMGVTNG